MPKGGVVGKHSGVLSRPLVWLAIMVTCVLPACSGGDPEPVAGPTTTSAIDDEAPSLPEFGTSPVSTSLLDAEGGERSGLLIDARLASQGSVDRFVLEFEEAVPPLWEVAYGDAPRSAECTAPQVTGDAFLNVYAYPSGTTESWSRPPRRSYEGPKRLQGDTRAVRQALLTCDFEGDLTWALVVERRLPFRVEVLESPPRLVIEVQAPDQ